VKSAIRPEDAQNPIRHLGLERGFPPSIAVQTAASEFANSVSSGAGSPIGRRCYEQNIETVALQGQHIERARVNTKG
jgi:hypothetical protein